ncbi:hypothetical protein NL390_32980, partial [Klebsiella pneumoniae]|nr:hypothetical protein [Klebsiella pneumoniae]
GMGYAGQAGGQAGGAETKFDRARLIALSLSLALIRGGERVGLLGDPPGSGAAQAEKLSFAFATRGLRSGDGDAPSAPTARRGQII